MPTTKAARYEARVEYFPPSDAHPESRDDTVKRVMRDGRSSDPTGTADLDSTTLRGTNRRVAVRAATAASIGLVIGAVAGLLLSIFPGPFETGGTGGTIGYMLVLGLAMAVVVGLLSTLLLLEREDGRVEAQKERAEEDGSAPLR